MIGRIVAQRRSWARSALRLPLVEAGLTDSILMFEVFESAAVQPE